MEKIEIIAELAQSYEGSEKIAINLVNAAFKAKADSVKFQIIIANELATSDYKHYNFFKQLEMPYNAWKKIRSAAKSKKIKFYLDVFGIDTLKIAERLYVDGIKIHPTDINNIDLLKHIKKSKIKMIFLGIGGAYLAEIKEAVKFLKNKKIILFIGFQSYPTHNKDNFINRINLIKHELKKKIEFGYADHTENRNLDPIIPSIVAIGAGARYIEKHLTIKRKKPLEDSESAIYSNDFLTYKKKINLAFDAYGRKIILKNDFGMSNSEKNYRFAIRRCFVSSRKLKKGYIFKNKKNLTLKRSSFKSSISDFKLIKNKSLKFNINDNIPINLLILNNEK